MSPAEKASFGKSLQDPVTGPMIRGTLGTLTTLGNFAFGPNKAVEAVANKFGIASLDFGKELKEMYGKAIGFADMTTAELEAAAQSYNDKVSKANQDNVSRVGTDRTVQAAALSRSYGATPSQIASHIDNISRGDAAPGTSANALGGQTTTGKYGFSTNDRNEVVGPDVQKQLERAKELDIDINSVVSPTQRENMKNGFVSPDLQKEIDKKDEKALDRFERKSEIAKERKERKDATLGLADLEESVEKAKAKEAAIGMADTEAEAADPTGRGGTETIGEADVWNIGGLIPKPKRKKQKNMKRGGLASR